MKTPRRGFLQSLLAAPLLPDSLAFPQAPPPSPPAPDPVVDALAGVVKARYGAQLDTAELDAVRGEIKKALEASDRLKAVKLGNGDEPATAFSARPKSGVRKAVPTTSSSRRGATSGRRSGRAGSPRWS